MRNEETDLTCHERMICTSTTSTTTTLERNLTSKNEMQVDERDSKHEQKLNAFGRESIKTQRNVEEQDVSQSFEKKLMGSVNDQISPSIKPDLITNEEIIDGFSFLSFQSEFDIKIELEKRQNEYFKHKNKAYQKSASNSKTTDTNRSLIQQQFNQNNISCSSSSISSSSTSSSSSSSLFSSSFNSQSLTKKVSTDKKSIEFKTSNDQIILKPNQRIIVQDNKSDEETLKEANSSLEIKHVNKNYNELNSYSMNESGVESSTKEASLIFSNISNQNKFQMHYENKNFTFQSDGLTKKSEANEKSSPIKKFKTSELHNLQQKLNDEITANGKSPMKTNNLIAESTGSHYLNPSFNQSNNANSSFNSSPTPFLFMPPSSSQSIQTACTNDSTTFNSNTNKINSFESFLNNKLLLEKQFSELSSTTSNPFEYMNKLMEFFQEQQNVLNTSIKTKNNNYNSTSPINTNSSEDLKLAKTLPYQNISFPDSTSTTNINHKQHIKSNTPTSTPHIYGFGKLSTSFPQLPSFSSDLNHSNKLEHHSHFLPSLNSKDSLHHEYWTPSSIGFKSNKSCYSEFNKLAKQVEPSTLPADLANRSKSTSSSFSLSSELHSRSPPPPTIPFSPLLLSQHQQQQSKPPSPFNTVSLNQQNKNLSSKVSNLLIPTSTDSFTLHSSNSISNESSISPHSINQQHLVSSATTKAPKTPPTSSISSKLSYKNELISNSKETSYLHQKNYSLRDQYLTNSSLLSSSNNNNKPNHYSHPHNNQNFLSSTSNLSSLTNTNLNSNSISSSSLNNSLFNLSSFIAPSSENQFLLHNHNLSIQNKNSPINNDILSGNLNKSKQNTGALNTNQSSNINSDNSKYSTDMFGNYNQLTPYADFGPLGPLAAAAASNSAATNHPSSSSSLLPTISSLNPLSSMIPPLSVPPSMSSSSHLPFNSNTDQTSILFNPADLLRRELDSRFLQKPFTPDSHQQSTSTSSGSIPLPLPSQPNSFSLPDSKLITSDMKHLSSNERNFFGMDQFLRNFPGLPFPPSFLPPNLPISPIRSQLTLNSTQSSHSSSVGNNKKALEKQTNSSKLSSQHTPPFSPFSNNKNASLHKNSLSTNSSHFTNSQQKATLTNRISKGKWCTAHIKIAHMIMMHKKQQNQQQNIVHSVTLINDSIYSPLSAPNLNQPSHYSSLNNNKCISNFSHNSSPHRNEPVQPSFNKTTASTFHPPVQSSSSFGGLANLSNDISKHNSLNSQKLTTISGQMSSNNRDKKSHQQLPFSSNQIGSSHYNPNRSTHCAKITEHDKSIKANHNAENRNNLKRARSRSRSRSPLNSSTQHSVHSNLTHNHPHFTTNPLHHSHHSKSNISKSNDSMKPQSNNSKSEKITEMSPQHLATEAAITAVAQRQLFLDRYKQDLMCSMSQSLPPLFTGLGSAVSSFPSSIPGMPIMPGLASVNSNVLPPHFSLNTPLLHSINSSSVLLSTPVPTSTSSSPTSTAAILSPKSASKQMSNLKESNFVQMFSSVGGSQYYTPLPGVAPHLSLSQLKSNSLPSFLQNFLENMTAQTTEARKDSPNIVYESDHDLNKLENTPINSKVKKEIENRLPYQKSEKLLERIDQDQESDKNELQIETNSKKINEGNVFDEKKQKIIVTNIDLNQSPKADTENHIENEKIIDNQCNKAFIISVQELDKEKQSEEIDENYLNKYNELYKEEKVDSEPKQNETRQKLGERQIETQEDYTDDHINNVQIDETLELDEHITRQEKKTKPKEIEEEILQTDESTPNTIN